jgi:hypothetical protein
VESLVKLIHDGIVRDLGPIHPFLDESIQVAEYLLHMIGVDVTRRILVV